MQAPLHQPARQQRPVSSRLLDMHISMLSHGTAADHLSRLDGLAHKTRQSLKHRPIPPSELILALETHLFFAQAWHWAHFGRISSISRSAAASECSLPVPASDSCAAKSFACTSGPDLDTSVAAAAAAAETSAWTVSRLPILPGSCMPHEVKEYCISKHGERKEVPQDTTYVELLENALPGLWGCAEILGLCCILATSCETESLSCARNCQLVKASRDLPVPLRVAQEL